MVQTASSDAAAASQAEISAEIAAIAKEYERDGTTESRPRLDYAPYRSSILRHPTKDLHHADPETIELAAPVFGSQDVDPLEADLTIQHLMRHEQISTTQIYTRAIADDAALAEMHRQASPVGRLLAKAEEVALT